MRWTVLYIAFGFVALWLLGEVLLQYKARLRWRLLAFTGFLGVVLGVLISSKLVIVVGALAFAAGQTCVTLSFRRGFSTGWAVGGKPGASRRRRRGSAGPGSRKPPLKVSEVESGKQTPDAAAEGDAFPVHTPQPVPDDTGQYGVCTDAAHTAADSAPGPGQEYGAHDPYDGQEQDVFGGRSAGPGQETYPGQDAYTGPFDYAGAQHAGQPTGQQGYAAYTDPYTTDGTADSGAYPGYDGYSHGDGGGHLHDGGGYQDDGYGGGGYGPQQPADPYAGPYGSDTPPGGVWVPQQRESEYPPPPEAPAHHSPYGNGYDTGQNEQYGYRG
ncbi:hypothetical protein OG909_06860 [Streptomyces sp. NBC_01754]|uniref:hypothetical protein n=1 Tax=Streptomyces sp. NBC_01754 TaxID=2975930 RepID=UPI002DD88928|nr:hypothetical protein [Streptomyces sp. NBC_01754]WSC92034.1 hypothetical protein OG909_06860 [Streptomyces sp. NBC_01754]